MWISAVFTHLENLFFREICEQADNVLLSTIFMNIQRLSVRSTLSQKE
jgi:hypothetical protein